MMTRAPRPTARAPRVALVHDWLVAQRGGEQVLAALCAQYPESTIFTLVHSPGAVSPGIEAHPITQSFIGRLPWAPHRFRQYLPLFPAAIEGLDVGGFDVVISTSHCVAHGIRTHKPQVHVAYVHTPMRYLYDQMPHYLPVVGARWTYRLARAVTAPLRAWDRLAAQRPTVIVANSRFVAARIARVWGRHAEVVYPPVDVAFFGTYPKGLPAPRRGLLAVGALVPYKRMEVAVAVSNATGTPLTIIGQGGQHKRLEALAGPQVTFLQGVSRQALRAAYQSHEALLFCGQEDFGIVPIEAMAAGCPILALGQGGLAETVCTDAQAPTGVLVASPTVAAFTQGLHTLRAAVACGKMQPEALYAHAYGFRPEAFVAGLQRIVQRA